MEKQIKGLENPLLENTDFKNWCENVSSQILEENILSKDNMSNILHNKILLNESFFYECICSELENKIERTKKRASIAFKKKRKQEYVEVGFILSSLNRKLKKYNMERNKAYQRNYYKQLKDFIISKGHEYLLSEFITTKENAKRN